MKIAVPPSPDWRELLQAIPDQYLPEPPPYFLLYSDASSSADSNIFTSDSPYLDLLRHALMEQKVISVELLESGSYNAIGFVKEIDDDVVTIQVVDSYGREDGIVHFSVNDITELQYNSEDEQRTNAYWQLRRNGRQPQ